MSQVSLFPWSGQLEIADVRTTRLCYQITGAVTVSPLPANTASLTFFAALSSQAQIDDFLGTSSEFLYTDFGSTAMGADAMGIIVNMGGQAASLVGVIGNVYSGSNGATGTPQGVVASALTDTLATQCELGANGNVAMKFAWGNTPDFDALTAGLIVIDILWTAK